ncbi:hypothetical protein BSL78_02689 [Apostichopus japonicus]|uniref:Uncharacterized protein n=1 Tax=Stichopus japonicus TaxID=307972 RepID=A0A2G8LJH1_STIJA|nr:hypothetical protein BSL78_02689 [Apostichopus japonicus]
MEPVTIAPGLNVKQTQGAATAVKWREPVVGFPARIIEDTNSKLNGGQLTQTTIRENDSSTLENGVPSSVVVVPQNDVDHSQTDLDSNANRASIQSRARARRSDEPAPFLCVDNLPMDKVIIDGKTSASPAVRKPPPPSSRKYQDFETAPPTSSLSTTRKGSAAMQSPGPPRATPKSTPRNTPSAGFYNYNSFFTHKNPAFLAGPPNLWSLNNRFWPHATPPLDKSNLPPLPSALSLEAATLRQNSQVIQPFKHGREPVIHKVNERASSPSFEMKAQTVKAIHDVTRQISKQSSTTSVKPSGRLLKGKLQPLHTFKMDGPAIEKCQGIQPEGTTRSYTPSQSRLLQRKRELLNMLPPDIFQTRPQTQESIHRTSVASNWDETRYNDLEMI